MDIVGLINDIAVGEIVNNDEIRAVVLGAGESGEYYNFGELGSEVHAGQTATIGFWQNKNGQKLLKAANQGLGDWLANEFPNIYGATSNFDLTGKTNADVAQLYKQTRFKVKGQKLDAQVMAVAFAVYVTDSDLSGTAASAYGFEVDGVGVGGSTFNVGSSGDAFDVANNTTLTVRQILDITNDRAYNGLLWDLNEDGETSRSEQFCEIWPIPSSPESTSRVTSDSVPQTWNKFGV